MPLNERHAITPHWFKFTEVKPKNNINYRNAQHKLDMDKAREIRRLAKAGIANDQLATMFDVNVSSIQKVVANKTYREE